MAILNNNTLAGSSGQGGVYAIDNSLRLRKSANGYLSKTPSGAGNRKTWTWSGWVKRGSITDNGIFGIGTSSSSYCNIRFEPEYISVVNYVGATQLELRTNALYRDPSAWYHIMFVLDTTESTASNRAKLYVNGEQVTSFLTATYPSLNADLLGNSTTPHYIGTLGNATSVSLDGYMTEVNFVDGTALAPSDFGETDDNGTWIPKKYTGTYGTNGFYLPMKPTTQATGFNSVLYTGNGGTQSITGVGFAPDFVWLKARTDGTDNNLLDAVRGNFILNTNRTLAQEAGFNGIVLNSNGFTVDATVGGTTSGEINVSGKDYVGWCWDAGGSTVTNTDGDITSSVRANSSAGFSIARYSGSATQGDTVGHGLSSAPQMVICKTLNDNSYDWAVYHSGLSATSKVVYLNLNAGESTSDNKFDSTAPTDSVVTLGNHGTNLSGTNNQIMYSFADVTGYQKIGSYTGNGSATGPSITTGFRPAWLLIKNINDTHGWQIYDATRNASNPRNNMLSPNVSNAEYSNSSDYKVDFNDNGFQIVTADAWLNANSQTMIYLAIAETRDEKFNFDASGNKNNWTPNNINSNASGDATYDLMSDVPTLTDEDTSNFATLNPLVPSGSVTINQANLKATSGTNAQRSNVSTISVSSGKYYWETTWNTVGANDAAMTGIIGVNNLNPDSNFGGTNSYVYVQDGGKQGANSYTGSYGDRYVAGDVIGTALDLDANTITFYRNGTTQGTAFTSLPSVEYYLGCSFYNSGDNFDINFGQRPFAYTPPSGFKKTNTFNLPDSTIKDGRNYFDTRLRTGTGSEVTVSDLEFQPDLLWTKTRSNAVNHNLHSSLMSQNYSFLQPNTTNAENNSASNYYMTPTSTGYIVGSGDNINQNTYTFVDWLWKAGGGTGVSNGNGSITSTVSANPTAGFSIVSYTGTANSTETVGHGLSKAPELILSKQRSATDNWPVYNKTITASKRLYLDATIAATTTSDWGSTEPTSSVYTAGGGGNNSTGVTMISYCFHSVDGYSKVGSYTGNGSADGPFVYTGFRPAFVMVKDTTVANGWRIADNKRPSNFNVINESLSPSDSAAANVSNGDRIDLLSNGFKCRDGAGQYNDNNSIYIYMAFAENPFKNSTAR